MSAPTIKEVEGGHLAKLRERANLTKRELAAKSKLYESIVARIENGSVRPDPKYIEPLRLLGTFEEIWAAIGRDRLAFLRRRSAA